MNLENKQSCHLKIRLDLSPEMAKHTARSVKMSNNAPHNYGSKPYHIGTAKNGISCH